ncbi:hypothetical protein IMZ48_24765 [Candidatus Bathyarchaeota archaeon]|nr:hypothetical protein [Candidatus Bathyarchaeota archaeon]
MHSAPKSHDAGTPAATPHIEARSLSSLNHLAANPPQYPVNPSEDRHEPLVLYLSRVPGTRGASLLLLPPIFFKTTPRVSRDYLPH